MFDLLLTIAVIFFAYKGYQWYQGMQKQVKGSEQPPTIDANYRPEGTVHTGDEDDYVEYEVIDDDNDLHRRRDHDFDFPREHDHDHHGDDNDGGWDDDDGDDD